VECSGAEELDQKLGKKGKPLKNPREKKGSPLRSKKKLTQLSVLGKERGDAGRRGKKTTEGKRNRTPSQEARTKRVAQGKKH